MCIDWLVLQYVIILVNSSQLMYNWSQNSLFHEKKRLYQIPLNALLKIHEIYHNSNKIAFN